MADTEPMDPGRSLVKLGATLAGGYRGKALFEVIDELNEHRKWELEQALQAEFTEEELDDALQDERKAQMTFDVFELVGREAAEAKRAHLGRVLRRALAAPDDARVDEAKLMLNTVIALEPVHVEFLARVSWEVSHPLAAPPAPGNQVRTIRAGVPPHERRHGPVSSSGLRKAWGPDRGEISPLWSALLAQGLVEVVEPNPQGHDPKGDRTITQWGRMFLDYLESTPDPYF